MWGNVKIVSLSALAMTAMVGCGEGETERSPNAYQMEFEVVNAAFFETKLGASLSPEPFTQGMLRVHTISPLALPNQVDLTDISIADGRLVNNTPYQLSELYLNNSHLHLVSLSQPLPPYSQAVIEPQFNESIVADLPFVSNSTFEYLNDTLPDIEGSHPIRHANATERSNSELYQIYDRYMYNAPNTLGDITEHLKVICELNSKCLDYAKPVERYASDTYVVKLASGLNTLFWIDDDTWGSAEMYPMNWTSDTLSLNANLWMNQGLMDNISSTNDTIAKDAWQALQHEHFHNFGFDHGTGWPDSNGIDDLFGDKVVDSYISEVGNKLILPNLSITDLKTTEDNKFVVHLASKNPDEPVYIRLLSTQDISANINHHNANYVEVDFKELPTSSVYASFYHRGSEQMATVSLRITKHVSTQSLLTQFNEQVGSWLSDYKQVVVSTRDGAWANSFVLPENTTNGRMVTFTSNASSASIIHYGNETLTLRRGDEFKFTFMNGRWTKV